mgnify:CR=1 FL=1
MTAPLHVVILAAGEGKRMRSALPKVLQKVAGRPMLTHVIATARELAPAAIHVVYGHGGDQVRAALGDQTDLLWAEQRERLGTGHAVQQALGEVPDGAEVVVLYGDVPLITAATLQRLLTGERGSRLAVLVAELDDPRAKLLINERSGRAAVQIPSTSVMLDDGEIERRVRLIRPMEAHNVPVRMMGETHWVEADRDVFASAWEAEVAEVPEFADSTLHMVTGLLLPIWKRLPNDSTRVYRLQSDAGERIIGRKVSPAWAANATKTGTASVTPDDAFAALMEGRTILDLAEGLQLRRVRVMGANRIELSGFTDMMRQRLSAYGLFHEIISWKLRMFVPVDGTGPAVLGKVLDRWPVERIGEREAA